jgi:hypothetical protein
MAEFDREDLKAAFEVGKIPVADDNIMRLDGLLRSLAQRYRARKVAREQDLNGKLTRLEETKSFLADLWDIEALLCGFEEETPQIISRLSGVAQHGVDFLKNEKEQRKIGRDDPETILFMDLRDIYGRPRRGYRSSVEPLFLAGGGGAHDRVDQVVALDGGVEARARGRTVADAVRQLHV